MVFCRQLLKVALGVSLAPQEQAISQQLMGQAGQMFGQPVAGQTQVTQAGLGALGAGQQLMGQPTFGVMPTQEAAGQAFGLGSQFMENCRNAYTGS